VGGKCLANLGGGKKIRKATHAGRGLQTIWGMSEKIENWDVWKLSFLQKKMALNKKLKMFF